MAFTLPGNGFITGAASGIGRQTAILFTQLGSRGIILCDRDRSGLEETRTLVTRENPETRVVICQADVSNDLEIRSVIRSGAEQLGRLDYAVNCAAISNPRRLIGDLSVDDMNRTLSVNAVGVFSCLSEECKIMSQQAPIPSPRGRPSCRGAIVNVASIMGISGMPELSPYVASKFAVIGLTKNAALEYAAQDIRVNTVCPGQTLTPAMYASFAEAETFETRVAALKDTLIPMKRLAEPQEIADSIAYLVSDMASFVTGQSLVADGGFTAR
ncbi:uncharacterized protein A1O9_12850 [Exophiala aquamarina CBS 119918]|uniref:3-oxoacyl-[acyl-carrier protein] reductase n=1 Tax=Exophiala aquamarina CBS 119918 TaxID=1182545 RepID=A0A072NUR0_9EURO|nr:uncharacterized protein A1O9_12850 [Exophiala aquamarina CBS 119918]KEF51127.1 hypothetical protein A1O9_12850 [Exophiala aquamarina CBS 119918]